MYQALYRKWRPRTFDDVVGQTPITETLKRQVASGRLSHAYLFTGTRGTGKTSCAKILARAVNCQQPVEGNPCNQCPACLGIEEGSILDVLELDAASNNGVDHVRALRDEAVYSPAAVAKRVYIVDEVHMLSTAAFNALLKILEEPPEHLLFILATTELHKVPATIKSRCQQFAFQRIQPQPLCQRLTQVAQAEEIDLTAQAAELLSRLADGGLRDGLSLLDQCAAYGGTVDVDRVLSALGLTGSLELVSLMEEIALHDCDAALTRLHRLYQGGRDVSSVLGELATLSRDLLLCHTAPKAAASLLSGNFDRDNLVNLQQKLPPARLSWSLQLIQGTIADLGRSSNVRIDAELCLMRLCDPCLEDSLPAVTARLAQLEREFAAGLPVRQMIPETPVVQEKPPAKKRQKPPIPTPPPAPEPPVYDEPPPWDMEPPPLPEELEQQWADPEPVVPIRPAPAPQPPTQPVAVPQPVQVAPTVAPVVAPPVAPTPPTSPAPANQTVAPAVDNQAFWTAVVGRVQGKVPRTVWPFLSNPSMVQGRYDSGVLTLWAVDDMVKNVLSKPKVGEVLTQAATAQLGQAVTVRIQVGKAPPVAQSTTAPIAPPVQTASAQSNPAEINPDKFNELLAKSQQFSNITVE